MVIFRARANANLAAFDDRILSIAGLKIPSLSVWFLDPDQPTGLAFWGRPWSRLSLEYSLKINRLGFDLLVT